MNDKLIQAYKSKESATKGKASHTFGYNTDMMKVYAEAQKNGVTLPAHVKIALGLDTLSGVKTDDKKEEKE